jgi:hypothetical protein
MLRARVEQFSKQALPKDGRNVVRGGRVIMRTADTNKSAAALAAVALACGLALGCNGASTSASSDPSVAGTYEQLGSQLQNCVSSALDCLKAANCDADKDQACRDDFKSCHEQNRAAFQAFGKAVQGCFDTEKMCVADTRGTGGTSGGAAGEAASTGTGGASPRQMCRQQFSSCVSDSRPIAPAPGPCMQGLKTCVMDSSNDRMQCFDDARTCFMDRLPPRCGGQHGHGMGGASGSSGAPANGGTGGA